MTPELQDLLDGLHFHTLCEQDSDALEQTLEAVAARFGDVLPRMRWLNFGGGHHITRPGYDLERLARCIRRAQAEWGVTVYLEPGEACALNAGYLASRVLDVLQNGETRIAVLDASAACHMPDVLEMPYRPPLYGAEAADDTGAKPRSGAGLRPSREVYRLAGPTCLAGDVIGDYGFDAPLAEGDLLLFGDMAIYTTCKNNTFNGMPLPAIYALREGGALEPLRTFATRTSRPAWARERPAPKRHAAPVRELLGPGRRVFRQGGEGISGIRPGRRCAPTPSSRPGRWGCTRRR